MSEEMSIRNQIFTAYESLFDAEKKVADYLMNYPEEAIEMSVSELAKKSEASQATIVRFCKKIGCSGFHQLKIKMAREMREKEEHAVSNEVNVEQIKSSLRNILASKIEELTETMNHMDEETIKAVIHHIVNAGTVEFAAMGNTIPVALDGSYKFNQLGIPAVASTIWETQQAFAFTLKKGDVLIAISASGASKHLLTMTDIAHKNGAVVAAITNQPHSPLAEASDYVIVTATRENIFHGQASFTRMAAMAVIDSLFLFLFSMKRDSFEYLSEHEQFVSEEKI